MPRRILFALAFLCLLAPTAQAEKRALPRMDKFSAEMQKLVTEEYPEAKADITPGKIDIAHKTRKFMIHLPLMTGEWQEASEMTGPDRKGVMVHIEMHALPYDGQAVAPQSFNRHYFTSYLLVPESKQCGCYLHATISYPGADTKPEFITAYRDLVNGFEKYLEY